MSFFNLGDLKLKQTLLIIEGVVIRKDQNCLQLPTYMEILRATNYIMQMQTDSMFMLWIITVYFRLD